MSEPRRFPIRFSRFTAVLMTPLGLRPGRTFVEIDGDRLRVRMGWAFHAVIDRAAIVDAGTRGYVWWAYGVHGWRGRWIVNGSGHNLVRLRIDPPARAQVLGVPVKLRELWVSLKDPEAFLAGC